MRSILETSFGVFGIDLFLFCSSNTCYNYKKIKSDASFRYFNNFFVLNLFILLNFHKINLFRLVLDKPDKLRKFHKKNTPLAGGIILFINIFIYFVILNFNKNLISTEIFFYNLNDLNYFIFTCCLIFFNWSN